MQVLTLFNNNNINWPCLSKIIIVFALFLTHFKPLFHFYTPWKQQKTSGFQMFLGGIEMERWLKMG